MAALQPSRPDWLPATPAIRPRSGIAANNFARNGTFQKGLGALHALSHPAARSTIAITGSPVTQRKKI